jgi:hypothetical protein
MPPKSGKRSIRATPASRPGTADEPARPETTLVVLRCKSKSIEAVRESLGTEYEIRDEWVLALLPEQVRAFVLIGSPPAGGEGGEDIELDECQVRLQERCLYLVIHGPGAVGEWQHRMGAQGGKGADASSLRGRFGTEAIHCSASVENVAREREFASGVKADLEADLATETRAPDTRSALVDPDVFFSFVLPPGVLHPKTTGRLYVYGAYGPTGKDEDGLEDGLLHAGYLGSHIVQPIELMAMINEMQREDILKIYLTGKQEHSPTKDEIEEVRALDGWGGWVSVHDL